MAVVSRLRPRIDAAKAEALSLAVRGGVAYRQNHVVIQRLLRFAYGAYIVLGTYKSLTPKPKKKKAPDAAVGAASSEREKAALAAAPPPEEEAAVGGRGKKKGKGRAPRVEVDAVFFARLRKVSGCWHGGAYAGAHLEVCSCCTL